MNRLLTVLMMVCLSASAANVRIWFQLPFSQSLDTNRIVAQPISTNILANGGVIPVGLPIPLFPATNGYVTNFFNIGWYSLTPTHGSAVVINVYDGTTTQYDYTSLLQSGFNTYVTTYVNTNGGNSISITNGFTTQTNRNGGIISVEVVGGLPSLATNNAISLTNVIAHTLDANAIAAVASTASGIAQAIVNNATNALTATNDVRSLLLTNAANQFSGLFTGNASGVSNTSPRPNKTWFVDAVKGNDSTADGTREHPFKTIGYQFADVEGTSLFTNSGALSQAQAGDSLRLMPGDYTNEFVQLWTTNLVNQKGISLIGSGPISTRIYSNGRLVGGSRGQNIIQIGNGSLIADLSCPGGNILLPSSNVWFNPLGNLDGTSVQSVYAADYYYGGSLPPYPIGTATNVTVRNFTGFGLYDCIFLGGALPYSVKFYDSSFYGYWDVFAVYGYNSNSVAGGNATYCYNCTMHPIFGPSGQSGNTMHGSDCHGGLHEFYDCTFDVHDGGPNTNAAFPSFGGTYGVFAEDGNLVHGQTNIVKLFNCKYDVTTTNAGLFTITNHSFTAGASVVSVMGGQGDYQTMYNATGFCFLTNGNQAFRSFTSSGTKVELTSFGGVTADGGCVFANGGVAPVTVTASGNISSSGFQSVAQALEDDTGGNHWAFQDSSGSYFDDGHVISDGAGNLTVVSIAGNGSALTALNASSLASGTVPGARFGGLSSVASPYVGTNAGNAILSYNGGGFTNIVPSRIVAGANVTITTNNPGASTETITIAGAAPYTLPGNVLTNNWNGPAINIGPSVSFTNPIHLYGNSIHSYASNSSSDLLLNVPQHLIVNAPANTTGSILLGNSDRGGATAQGVITAQSGYNQMKAENDANGSGAQWPEVTMSSANGTYGPGAIVLDYGGGDNNSGITASNTAGFVVGNRNQGTRYVDLEIYPSNAVAGVLSPVARIHPDTWFGGNATVTNTLFASTLVVSNNNAAVRGGTNYAEFNNTNSGAISADLAIGTNKNVYIGTGNLFLPSAAGNGQEIIFGGGGNGTATNILIAGRIVYTNTGTTTAVFTDNNGNGYLELHGANSAGVTIGRGSTDDYLFTSSVAEPNTDVKYDLGASGQRWKTFYVTNVIISGSGFLTANNGVNSQKNNLAAPSTITVGSSPFSYTNTAGVNIEVYIDANGATTAVQKNGGTIFTTLVAGDHTVTLQNNEYVTVTYSVATPNMKFSTF